MIKGKIIIIGGGVDIGDMPNNTMSTENIEYQNFYNEGVLKRILDESKNGINSTIEVITTASRFAIESATSYINAFNLLGAFNVNHLHLDNRIDCRNETFVKRLADSDIVFFYRW